MFWFFGQEAWGTLSACPGIKPTPPTWKGKVPWSARKSLVLHTCFFKRSIFPISFLWFLKLCCWPSCVLHSLLRWALSQPFLHLLEFSSHLFVSPARWVRSRWAGWNVYSSPIPCGISEHLVKEGKDEWSNKWPHVLLASLREGGQMSTESLQNRVLPATAWSVEWLGLSESCVSAQNKLPSQKHRPPQGGRVERQSLLVCLGRWAHRCPGRKCVRALDADRGQTDILKPGCFLWGLKLLDDSIIDVCVCVCARAHTHALCPV